MTPAHPIEHDHVGHGRLVSLDVFRGMVIAFMVLVNNAGDGGNSYWPLEHAEWDGWTPTDVVFPSFVWIVGVALTLSLARRMAAGASRGVLFRQALRRSAILLALGLLVYAAPAFDPATQRLPGVLQRLAVCYLAAAGIFLTTKLRGQIAAIAVLLGVYWLLMKFYPVPGFGPGRLDMEGNFAHYIDRIVLGAHNYHATRTWDPEGIVSTLPAIATALFGVLCGHIVREDTALGRRVRTMAALGVVLMIAGGIFNVWMPINKKLWSVSFVFFMAGLDYVLFAICLWVVDGLRWRSALRPFVIVGLNPITVYMVAELLDEALSYSGLHRFLYMHVFAPAASPANASLLWAVAYTGLMYLVAWTMYKRGWVVKV